LDEILTLLKDNKEWLFSGVGVVIVAGICRFFFKKRQAELTQTIQAGERSTSVQSGRDTHINLDKRVNKK
jgi:hypothetical protein